MVTSLVAATSPPGIGDFSWTGKYTAVDLIACRGGEEPVAKEPAGVYRHNHGRPPIGTGA